MNAFFMVMAVGILNREAKSMWDEETKDEGGTLDLYIRHIHSFEALQAQSQAELDRRLATQYGWPAELKKA